MADFPGSRDPHFASQPFFNTNADFHTIEETLACPTCGVELTGTPDFDIYCVCPTCCRHFPIPARARLRLLVDSETFRETNAALVSLEPLVFRDLLPVPDRLAEAAERAGSGPGSGVSEAVLTGTAAIGGHQAVVIVLDHAFLGASIGPVAGEKILLAMETATARRLPLIALCTAGGARTQEGLLGLLQAPKIAAAAAAMHRTGVPFVSVLAHPATGAIWTALATQADIILAEPGAHIGPSGQQSGVEQVETSESLLTRGMIDSIVHRPLLRATLSRILGLFADRGAYHPAPFAAFAIATPSGETDAARRRAAGWEEARLAHHPQRPRAEAYLTRLVTDWVELHGDRTCQDDAALLTGLGRIAGAPVAVVASQGSHVATAGAFRKARRILRLAGHLELPVVAFIDAPGTEAGQDSAPAETAAELAGMIGLLGLLPVPVISVVIGEAAGAAGVAFAAGDRLLMQEHAISTVGGAAGVDRRAAGPLAASRALTASECQRLGFADIIVPEPRPAAHANPDVAARMLGSAIATTLTELASIAPRRLLDDRALKLRALGQTTPEAREAARYEVRELQELQRTLARSLGDLRVRLEGLHLPQLQAPQLPGPVRDRVHLDTSALPTLDRARSELGDRIERAVRLAPWLQGDSPSGDDLSPVSAHDEGPQ